MKATVSADDLSEEREKPDEPGNGQRAQRKQTQPEDRAAPVGRCGQGDKRQAVDIADEAHARRAEADHARCQHDAERQQQNGEQTEGHIQPAEPQPGERGGTALCTLRRGLKLRGKVGGASEASGDLFFRVAAGELKGKMLFVLLQHIGGVGDVSLVQLRGELVHKFKFRHDLHPPKAFSQSARSADIRRGRTGRSRARGR